MSRRRPGRPAAQRLSEPALAGAEDRRRHRAAHGGGSGHGRRWQRRRNRRLPGRAAVPGPRWLRVCGAVAALCSVGSWPDSVALAFRLGDREGRTAVSQSILRARPTSPHAVGAHRATIGGRRKRRFFDSPAARVRGSARSTAWRRRLAWRCRSPRAQRTGIYRPVAFDAIRMMRRCWKRGTRFIRINRERLSDRHLEASVSFAMGQIRHERIVPCEPAERSSESAGRRWRKPPTGAVHGRIDR